MTPQLQMLKNQKQILENQQMILRMPRYGHNEVCVMRINDSVEQSVVCIEQTKKEIEFLESNKLMDIKKGENEEL